jgi:lysophospholipid acyltransferase (LPLAT)-like uncharacterized protein
MAHLRDAWFELRASAAGGLSPALIRAMVATCRVTCQSQDLLDRARRGEAFIGVLWHQDLVFFGDFLRGSGFTILASRSRDGEIGARIAHRLGLQTVRGSSSRGAEEALAELIEIARRGECIGFVADGPRGPSGIAKIGPIIAAKLSGRPIVPMACAMRGGFRLRSWDRMRVPMFAKIVARAGEAIPVPQDATRDDCERLRQQLQDELMRTESIAAEAL